MKSFICVQLINEIGDVYVNINSIKLFSIDIVSNVTIITNDGIAFAITNSLDDIKKQINNGT
jgi:hypothetical protein